MFVYNNSGDHHNQKVSIKQSTKAKTARRKSRKQGKSLKKANTKFLKALGFLVRKSKK